MTVRRTARQKVSLGISSGGLALSHRCILSLTLEELLLQLGLGDLNLDGLVDLLRVTAAVVGVVLDRGREKSVDEGGLAET